MTTHPNETIKLNWNEKLYIKYTKVALAIFCFIFSMASDEHWSWCYVNIYQKMSRFIRHHILFIDLKSLHRIIVFTAHKMTPAQIEDVKRIIWDL